MDKINEIIFYIEAILAYAKDIHYNNTGYESHLLADRIVEGVDIQDDIKEQMILAEGNLPLPSYEYFKGAIPLIPDVTEDNNENWMRMADLIDRAQKKVEKVKGNRGGNALIDNLAQALNTSNALLFIQTRQPETQEEPEEAPEAKAVEESVKTEEGNGKETPVDRKEFKKQVTADEDVEKTIIGQSNQVAALGESTLDRVSRKLGL